MEAIQTFSSVPIPFTYALRADASGNVAVPVSDAGRVNAEFRNIRGMPLPGGGSEGSVPYNRLRQLDMLIDQLSRVNGRDISVETEIMDKLELENLIVEFSQELNTKLNSLVADYYTGIYSPGSLLNMTA